MASPLTPFKHLVRLIEENRVSAIPIVDQQGIPIGLVSETDLLLKQMRRGGDLSRDLLHLEKRRQERAKAAGIVASDVMTSPVITVGSDTDLSDAARLMHDKNLRRLVVVDEGRRIAGIVSRTDLLKVFLRSDAELLEEIQGELIPAVLMAATDASDALTVEVRWNIATLSGAVDRKSDAEILTRLTGELDGVVAVVNELTYSWDDTAAAPAKPVSPQRHFRAI
jgi:CBS domain-containing protein